MKASLLALTLLCLSSSFFLRAAEIRYEDVIYLDEIRAKPIPLKTTSRVALTVSRDQSTVLTYLSEGQKVSLLGFGAKRHYVETLIASGKARGWVDIDAVELLPKDIRADIEKRVATARRHKELIAKHEIEVGMNKSQVQSALGKPVERTRTQEGGAVEEEWIYRLYKSIPQRDYFYVDGKLSDRVYYKKVSAGGKTVTFRDDQVVAIKDEDKLPEPSSPTVTLPPPVIYGY